MLTGQTVTKENLLQWIEDYRWMVETIEEARQPVGKADNNSYIGAGLLLFNNICSTNGPFNGIKVLNETGYLYIYVNFQVRL
ncbi:hypothetical protein [Lysinibacillus fusiformis]|uniref:hypothetical protein n=1 Tax=Lysinibacillus fusiformis TaxID=28031 RepID=UPI003CF4A2BB